MTLFRPRLLVAGTSGDSGKTLVSVGLARAWARRGLPVAPFKKGPDYIDAAWLGAAAGRAARNLDTFLVDPPRVRTSFIANATGEGVNLLEGNRGLHDGVDAEGTHSSAALARLLDCPVILVQDVTKTTRSAAASVLGHMLMDRGVRLAGVVLNRVGGARHEGVVRRSIEKACGVPVLGALPRLDERGCIPMRHLGLVTPVEETRMGELVERTADRVERHLDLEALLEIARGAPGLEGPEAPAAPAEGRAPAGKGGLRIGVLRDAAFSFYYPENLEALEAAGAEVVYLSSLEDRELPMLHALYAGGGFPEEHAPVLAENAPFRRSLYEAAAAGLPVYAECGGLIFLAERLRVGGREYPMTGILPLAVEMETRPQGHGYVIAEVEGRNPFFPAGTEIRGHEFHYTRLAGGTIPGVFRMKRGVGVGGGRDGLCRWNVLGTYIHVHALGCPAWATGLVSAAERHRKD